MNYYSKVDTYKYIFDDGDYNVEGDRKNKKVVKFYTFDELRAYLGS